MAVLIAPLRSSRYTLMRRQVLRALKVPRATPPCAPPIPLPFPKALLSPSKSRFVAVVFGLDIPPIAVANQNTVITHGKMEYDTKTRTKAPNCCYCSYIGHRLTCDTAKSVTSDPKSFASESVRMRWPVILVRPPSRQTAIRISVGLSF